MGEGKGTIQQTSWRKTGIMTGVFFGFWMTVYYGFVSKPWYHCFVPGIISGLLFGLIMAWFGKRQSKKLTLNRPDLGTERWVFEGPANHFVGAESVGGYLFLTDARLFFRSHRYNIQNHETTLALGDIEAVEATKVIGIFPKGLSVRLRSGQTEKFVVNDHKVWREKLLSAMKGLP